MAVDPAREPSSRGAARRAQPSATPEPPATPERPAPPERPGAPGGHDPGTPLSPTARVILGMLAALGKETGYDIKQLVDKSTRHFWAASYGQIYPELRRLESEGLIRGRPEPTGGRARTVYELTAEGTNALHEWLSSDEEPFYELRDEGMLKLFFSDALPERRIEHVRAVRERMERKLAQLDALGSPEMRGPALTLSMGKAVTKRYIEWCEATERELANQATG
jgi:PadR family transcriptional regulator, regulatory protein AphA